MGGEVDTPGSGGVRSPVNQPATSKSRSMSVSEYIETRPT
jgi:hypothetical protein